MQIIVSAISETHHFILKLIDRFTSLPCAQTRIRRLFSNLFASSLSILRDAIECISEHFGPSSNMLWLQILCLNI